MQNTKYRKVLRILWAIAGISFIWCDVFVLGNSALKPDFWLLIGVLAFLWATTGMAGGIGAMLITQGILMYKANMAFVDGKLDFTYDFGIFSQASSVIFILYGSYLLYRQIRKNLRKMEN